MLDREARDHRHGTADQVQWLAQRTFFAASFPEAPDDLYSCSTDGVIERARERVVIQPHAQLSTNAFFGRFPASYWQRWTEVTQVEVSAIVRGTGRITVRASDSAGDARTVATVMVEGAQHEQVRLSARIGRFVDGGAMWLEASTGEAALVLDTVHWSVARPARDRRTAVVICTYNRADDCLHTLQTLSLDDTALSIVDTVYVVDQGNDTVESRPGFAEVGRTLGPKLHYLRQSNLGGAGGFTRGLYEATEVNPTEVSPVDHAHILFMDDDIMLEPTQWSGSQPSPTARSHPPSSVARCLPVASEPVARRSGGHGPVDSATRTAR
ncbi:MAG TPA: glycosyltransferase [Pseudonocardiaceae bacterium]|nr:glycosyltransferase [Pseudonocardiaceae bacterium]